MSNVAVCMFGTTAGVKTLILPEDFSLPDPLYQVVDTSLPFLWGKEVYRWQGFEVDGEIIHLFAIYTKIDDVGGPRDGAFAGAGVFIKNGYCDCEVIASTLRNLLINLLQEGTNGKQFKATLNQFAPQLNAPMRAAGVRFQKSYFSGNVIRPRRNRTHARGICTNEKWFFASPAHFFEAARVSTDEKIDDFYYSADIEFIAALRDFPDVQSVEPSADLLKAAANADLRIVKAHQDYRQRLEGERKDREAAQVENAKLKSEFQDSVHAEVDREIQKSAGILDSYKVRAQESESNLAISQRKIQELQNRVSNLENSLRVANSNLDQYRSYSGHGGGNLDSGAVGSYYETAHSPVHTSKKRDTYLPNPQNNSRDGAFAWISTILSDLMLVIVAFLFVIVIAVLIYYFVPMRWFNSVVGGNIAPAAASATAKEEEIAAQQKAQADARASIESSRIASEKALKYSNYFDSSEGTKGVYSISASQWVPLRVIFGKITEECAIAGEKEFLGGLSESARFDLVKKWNPKDSVYISEIDKEFGFKANKLLTIEYRLPAECKLLISNMPPPRR